MNTPGSPVTVTKSPRAQIAGDSLDIMWVNVYLYAFVCKAF